MSDLGLQARNSPSRLRYRHAEALHAGAVRRLSGRRRATQRAVLLGRLGCRGAWHAYQESFYSTLLGEVLPPVGDGRRAGCWKKARRQRGKIEAQREKKAADVALVTDENDVTNESQQQLHKRLKVSEHWRSEHAASILELRTSTPRASPSGKHAVRELRAVVATPGGVNSRECCAEVRYDLLPAEGESEEAAKQRDDRNRRREQLALGRLAGVPEQEEQVRRKEEAAEAARLERMAAVVRDGNFILLTWFLSFEVVSST